MLFDHDLYTLIQSNEIFLKFNIIPFLSAIIIIINNIKYINFVLHVSTVKFKLSI